MLKQDQVVICQRCGSQHVQQKVRITSKQGSFYYCPACLMLGRVQSNQVFYQGPAKSPFPAQKWRIDWEGELTASQEAGSRQILTTVQHNRSLLVHGVTGAGKTEMLFSALLWALQQQKRICLASPRVDVCLELYPRLQQVFPQLPISLLHGGQSEPYHYSQLVLCTTHQLLRFKAAFDVMIIDEIDAFPFTHEPFLAHGVSQARLPISSLIYLTATPSRALWQAVKAGELAYVMIPSRYHGRLLPVPRSLWLPNLRRALARERLPRKLSNCLARQIESQTVTLIFCPSITLMHLLQHRLENHFPTVIIGAASAKDPQRAEKVQRLRDGHYALFLTTTILERGVTLPGIDVIVLESHHPVFSESALVQIAGRVGRSPAFPQGQVLFFHQGWTRAMVRALAQINAFNRLARKRKKEGLR